MKGIEVIDALNDCKQKHKSSDKCLNCPAYLNNRKECVRQMQYKWEKWNEKVKAERINL